MTDLQKSIAFYGSIEIIFFGLVFYFLYRGIKAKNSKTKALWLSLQALMAAFLLLIVLSLKSMIFIFMPLSTRVVQSAFHVMGYEFSGYDLHGGWNFVLRKIEPPVSNSGSALDQFDCRDDSDCRPTKEKGCVNARMTALNYLIDESNEQTKCECLKGPVEFGCVLAGSK